MLAAAIAILWQAAAPAVAGPTAQDFLDVYPKAALARSRSGRAVLACRLDERGFFAGCQIASEFPEGEGFGAAALALQSRIQLKASPRVRKDRDGRVMLPVRFDPPRHDPPPEDPQLHLAHPDWTRTPTGADLARFYPDRALRGGVSGMAVGQCRIAGDRLTDCAIVYEDPVDAGFGPAALKLLMLFRAAAKTPDGAPVEGRLVRVPIYFALS